MLHGDNSLDQTQGIDVSDCWEEPMILIEKIPVDKFDICSKLKEIELKYGFPIDKEEIDEIYEKYKKLLL